MVQRRKIHHSSSHGHMHHGGSSGKAGHYAFLAGVLLALFLGLFPSIVGEYQAYTAFVLVLLGLAVGFLNITAQEAIPFLIAAIALSVGSGIENLSLIPYFGSFLSRVFTYISMFVAPAAIIVAIKTVYALAESR